MTLPLISRLLADVNSSSSSSSVDDTPQSHLVDSDFVVILAALLCALICVLGLVAVARCAWIRRIAQTSPPPSTSTTSGAPPATNKGLNKKILNSLPRLTYSPAEDHHHHHDHSAPADGEITAGIPLSSGKFSVDCPICLAELVSGDEIRLLPQCRHMFHVGCIDKWFKSHSSCPSCRVQVATPNPKQQQQQCHKCRELASATSSSCSSAAATTTAPSPRNLM